MKTIKILGESIDIRFNMATMLAYEEISGTPYFGTQFDTQKARYALLMAAIISSAPGTKITPERLLQDAPWQEVITAFNAVAEEMSKYFTIPEVMKSETDNHETTEDHGEVNEAPEEKKN